MAGHNYAVTIGGAHLPDNGDKCHQLHYAIRKFNFTAKNTFHLGPHASFDEGGTAMLSQFCPVRQYNKDKPDKFRVDFFVLVVCRDISIYHLDLYPGKNKADIDIGHIIKDILTTQKAVAITIIKSGIANDPNG
eukprot:11326148-Ditylum_brightwellii.AAC.1